MKTVTEESVDKYEKVLESSAFVTRENDPILYYARLGALHEMGRALDLLAKICRGGSLLKPDASNASDLMYHLNRLLLKYDVG